MSDPKGVSDDQKESNDKDGGATNEEQYVSKKAYEQVTKDMHKYKKTAKELEAARNEYEAKLKQIEEEKLAEQEKWKELYEQRNQELEETKAKASEKERAYLNSVKKSALKSELGVKDAYLVHADLNAIEFNEDGTLNMDSVHEVANKFRENHGELIPKTQRKEATNEASPKDKTVSQGKSIDDISGKEAYQILRQRAVDLNRTKQ